MVHFYLTPHTGRPNVGVLKESWRQAVAQLVDERGWTKYKAATFIAERLYDRVWAPSRLPDGLFEAVYAPRERSRRCESEDEDPDRSSLPKLTRGSSRRAFIKQLRIRIQSYVV